MIWDDPQTKKGKFCELCGQEHFNEGELCSKCMKYEKGEDE